MEARSEGMVRSPRKKNGHTMQRFSEFSRVRDRTDTQLRENARKIAELRVARTSTDRRTGGAFVARVVALQKLTPEPKVRIVNISIFLIFITIYLCPVLAKWLTPLDGYEFFADHQTDAIAIERMNRLLQNTDAVAEITQKAFAEALTSSQLNPRRKELRAL